MKSYNYRRNNRYKTNKFSRKTALPVLALIALFLLNSKDVLYFNNGRGGIDWKIGTPHVNVFNAHQPRDLSEIRELALELVNRDRSVNGLPPLIEDTLLSQAAQIHAEDMLDRGYYSHVTPEGETPSDRFNQIGGQGGVGENIVQVNKASGENVAFVIIESFQRSWMYSDGHRENLLRTNYIHFGYGIASDPLRNRVVAVQKFRF